MELESLDVLIVLVVTFGILRGVTTGAIRQVISLVGTIVAIVLGLELMNVVGGLLGAAIGLSDALEPVLGFFLVFLAIQIGLLFGAKILEAAVKMLKLNPLNRAAGAVLGAIKTLLILSVLFLVMGFFDVPEEENRRASVLYEPVASVFPATWDFVARYLPYMRDLSEQFGQEIESVLTDRTF